MTNEIKQHLETHFKEIVRERERDPFLATQGHFYVKEYIRQELQKWGTVESCEFNDNNNNYDKLIVNLPSKLNNKVKKPI